MWHQYFTDDLCEVSLGWSLNISDCFQFIGVTKTILFSGCFSFRTEEAFWMRGKTSLIPQIPVKLTWKTENQTLVHVALQTGPGCSQPYMFVDAFVLQSTRSCSQCGKWTAFACCTRWHFVFIISFSSFYPSQYLLFKLIAHVRENGSRLDRRRG